MFGAAVCSMVGGGLYFYYCNRSLLPASSGRAHGAQGLTEEGGRAIAAPTDFEHPLNKRPLLFRWWLVARRVCWLVLVFTPFVVCSGIMLFLNTPAARERWIRSLVSCLENAGCSFQKFGQWMSMRPDMLPPDVIDALSKLRMDVPTHGMEHNDAVIFAATGMRIPDIFSSFDEIPVASGTVAQVHRAVLKAPFSRTGISCAVAVKVRHPNVEEETFVDIDLIFAFINTLGENFGHFSIPFTKEEFHLVLQRQIDFRWEGHNLDRFCNNFEPAPPLLPRSFPSSPDPGNSRDDAGAGWPSKAPAPLNRWRSEVPAPLGQRATAGGGGVGAGRVCFPQIENALLSQALLVETWAPGCTVQSLFDEVGNSFKMLPEQGRVFSEAHRKHKREIARKVYDVVMKMFLRDNCIHGDVHAGNVLFCAQTGQITVIDAGVVCQVEEQWRGKFHDFLIALCTGDVAPLAERLLDFNQAKHVDADAFKRDIALMTRKWIAEPGMRVPRAPDGGPVMLGDLVGEILFTIQRHHLHLRGDIASTIVTMSLVEGLVKQLDPDFDVVNSALPYFLTYPPPDSRVTVPAR